MNKINNDLLDSAKQCLEVAKTSSNKSDVVVNLKMVKSFLNAMRLEEYRDNADIDQIVYDLSKKGSKVKLVRERLNQIKL